jgi:hypothetical protein
VSVSIHLRLPAGDLAALDAYIATEPKGLSRPEAIRLLIRRADEPRRTVRGTASVSDFPGAAAATPPPAGRFHP